MAKRAAEDDGLGGPNKRGPGFEQAQVQGGAAEQEEEDDAQQDEELDAIGIPTGWRQCPRMGHPVDRFIPMKVPLGARYDAYIKPEDRFSPLQAKMLADEAVAGRSITAGAGSYPMHVSMVVDLTRSSRYYDARQWGEMGMVYCKIPCQGRGAAPEPAAVNEFVGEMMRYIMHNPGGMVLIHCTHGFNRTGYMVVSYLVRMLALTVEKALRLFIAGRAPGIYKHYYIRQLFQYYHERVPRGYPYPPMPEWKAGDSPEREEGEEPADGAVGHGFHHEDELGEHVSWAEYCEVVNFVISAVRGECHWDPDSQASPIFPGSQPVSLDRHNINMLTQQRYWVTWKADGTRYMIAIMRYGTYLVDRKFQIRRVQMRFPMMPNPHHQGRPAPVGPPHNCTLLDGEMVVDEDLEGNQTRRFLIYDLVAVNRASLVQRPWKDRYAMIEDLVVRPRTVEKHKIEKGEWNHPYQYEKELFRVRRKEFWPLPRADKLLNKFIPNLCHEADGLIFQPYHTTYSSGTCPDLLKYKFPHLNSVDFKLRLAGPERQPQLLLLQPKGRNDYALIPLQDARVVFPEDDPPELHDGHIVECVYDHDQAAWVYLRIRRDKNLPNAKRVFEKVFSSIQDNITEADILQFVEATLTLDIYNRDTGRGGGQRPPAQQPAHQPPPQQAQQQQPPQEQQPQQEQEQEQQPQQEQEQQPPPAQSPQQQLEEGQQALAQQQVA